MDISLKFVRRVENGLVWSQLGINEENFIGREMWDYIGGFQKFICMMGIIIRKIINSIGYVNDWICVIIFIYGGQ